MRAQPSSAEPTTLRPLVALPLIALLSTCQGACDSNLALAPLPDSDAGPPLLGTSNLSTAGAVRFDREDAGRGEDAGPPREGPPYPVVLVHGFSGFNSLGPLEYYFQILDKLAEIGETEVFAPTVPPYAGVVDRAPFLAQAIDEVLAETRAEKVHLIAHSQGGLDARYVISVLGYATRVATLTTVATPHRGTPLADHVLGLPEDTLDPVARTLAWLIGALDSPDNAPGEGSDDASWRNDMDASARSLATATVRAYNLEHPDDPRVPIFSIAAVSNLQRARDICEHSEWGAIRRVDVVDPLLVATAPVLSGWNPFDRVPNDGIVPTASMVWGHFVGCIPADHFDEVGQIADLTPHLISGFDHRDFYRELVNRLRRWELEQSQP